MNHKEIITMSLYEFNMLQEMNIQSLQSYSKPQKGFRKPSSILIMHRFSNYILSSIASQYLSFKYGDNIMSQLNILSVKLSYNKTHCNLYVELLNNNNIELIPTKQFETLMELQNAGTNITTTNDTPTDNNINIDTNV